MIYVAVARHRVDLCVCVLTAGIKIQLWEVTWRESIAET